MMDSTKCTTVVVEEAEVDILLITEVDEDVEASVVTKVIVEEKVIIAEVRDIVEARATVDVDIRVVIEVEEKEDHSDVDEDEEGVEVVAEVMVHHLDDDNTVAIPTQHVGSCWFMLVHVREIIS